MLLTKEFFDLEDFEHKALFEGELWRPLERLSAYVKEFPHRGVLACDYPGVYFSRPEWITVGEGCSIGPGALIEGPCIIGRGVEIRHGAFVRAGSILGDGAIVGHGSEVARSIFLGEAKAPHLSYVGDSILSRRVNLGAGSVCSNVRLDKRSVTILIEGERVDTGLKKLGAIIGDDASLGCHVVTNPGTLIYPGALIAPGSVVKGAVR